LTLLERFAVDIVINNFNYGRFLSTAIESALAQTHDAVTIIVVDDGSTDESRDVIRSFGDKVIPVLKENGGQASALNAGFMLCVGSLVIFLDADDVLAADVTARAASVFAQEPSLAKIQYRMEVIDGRGARTGIVKPTPHLPLLQGDLRRHAASFAFDMTWTATSGNAFSTRLLRGIFPIPESFRLGADWYLLHLTPLLGEVASLDSVGAYYRVHGSNNYELPQPALDLEHVRQTIAYAEQARPYIETLAAELSVSQPGERVLSVSAIANRLVSLRLEPERHPVEGDRRMSLTAAGVRASVRRFDVSWPMKGLFIAWFVTVAVAPRWLARPLAERFLIPERRQRFNRLLRALHRTEGRSTAQSMIL